MDAMVLRPCLVCHRPTKGSRHPWCDFAAIAYASREYAAGRREVFERSEGRCEALLPDGSRCSALVVEAHHVVALEQANSAAEAIAMSTAANLLGVCLAHNP